MKKYEIFRLQMENIHLLENTADGVFDYPVDLDLARVYLAGNQNVLYFALHQNLVVGMVSGISYSHPDKPLEMWINEVAVGQAYRRQGIGRTLLKAIETHALDVGCNGCWLLTEVENVPARRLYQSLPGWTGPRPQIIYGKEFQSIQGDEPERVSGT